METYRDRNLLLLELGYRDYYDYLNSDLWKDIRRTVIEKYGTKCRVCYSSRVHSVHHISYTRDVLLGENLEQLVPVCEECHLRIEFRFSTNRGEPQGKYTLEEAKQHYYALLRIEHKRRTGHNSPDLPCGYRINKRGKRVRITTVPRPCKGLGCRNSGNQKTGYCKLCFDKLRSTK